MPGLMRGAPARVYLVELAFRCDVSTDWILGTDILEAELLEVEDLSFSGAVDGLRSRTSTRSGSSYATCGTAREVVQP